MKEGSSKEWRRQGDARAFDAGTWEYGSRQFLSSSKQLIQHFDSKKASPDFDGIMSLGTSQFLVCLALELLCKAVYLQREGQPREKIYTHNVAGLLPEGLLDEEQIQLLRFAERYVIWAGRYPTPKWKHESNKEDFDVPSTIIDGQEHIKARDLPNSASTETVARLFVLYEHIRTAWHRERDA